MNPRPFLVTLALLAGAGAAPLAAEGLLSPFVGVAFGGRTDDAKLTYGGTLTLKSAQSPLGFAVDFGYAPDFLGTSGYGNNNVTTLMGNLVFMSGGAVRFYASGGLGLVKTRVRDLSGLFRVDSNELGFDAGGGVVMFPGHTLGLQGDIRYFRNLTDPQPDAEFDVALGGLGFWRATGGVALKF